MTDNECAYVAGIIDGEGTVEARSDRRNVNWMSLRIGVANSNHDLIYWLNDRMPGVVCARKTYKEHHLPQLAWYVSGLKAIQVAREIKDYVIIKREHLELLIELEAYRAYYHPNHQGRYIDPETVIARQPLLDRMLLLNRRNNSQWKVRAAWRRLNTPEERNGGTD